MNPMITNPMITNPMVVASFFDQKTSTISHIIHAGDQSQCAIVDSVLDYEPNSGSTFTLSADELIQYVEDHQLKVQWLLETHVHADHFSAAKYLQGRLGGQIAIGQHIKHVQEVFKGIFNLSDGFSTDGDQFDVLFADQDVFWIGDLQVKVMYVPGHTPACVAYYVEDAIFVGDTLFGADVGTARCDFPGGDAYILFESIQKILSLPDETKIYLCHDYPPTERDVVMRSTVAQEKAKNIHVHRGISSEQFVQMRTQRDQNLEMPRLIMPSIQVNMRAGEFPEPENNGVSYLKIPLNMLKN